MEPIHELMAEICRTLAHPARIAILHVLAEGPVEVTRIATELGVSQPNASQHLAVMRQAGLVEPVREGREVRYRLADPAVLDACDGMARVMRRRLARIADLSARIGPETERRDGAAAAGREPVAPLPRSVA
jgi:ArsR family transcriptional regulator